MFEHIKSMLQNSSNTSSARTINFMGAIIGAVLLIVDTIVRHGLDPVNFGIFMGYCGGVYVGGKYLGKDTNATN